MRRAEVRNCICRKIACPAQQVRYTSKLLPDSCAIDLAAWIVFLLRGGLPRGGGIATWLVLHAWSPLSPFSRDGISGCVPDIASSCKGVAYHFVVHTNDKPHSAYL